MKNIKLLLIILTISTMIKAQNAEKKINSSAFYRFNFGAILKTCDVNGVENIKEYYVPKNSIFQVENYNDKGYIIKLLPIYCPTNEQLEMENKLLFLTKDMFKEKVIEVEPKHSVTFGTVTLPIKLRLPNNEKDSNGKQKSYLDITNDINVGLTIGYKYRRNFNPNSAHNFLFGINLVGIKVDSASTVGFQKTAITTAAVSPMFGYVWETNQFQLGVFTGYDYIPGEIGTKWIYANQWWLGVGIGYSIFSKDVNKTSTQE